MTQSLDAIMADRDASLSAQSDSMRDTAVPDHTGGTPQGAYDEDGHPDAPHGLSDDTQSGRSERQPGMVPQQALHAERQVRRALEREIGEIRHMLQAQQPQPDPLTQFANDPAGFLQQQVSPVAHQVNEMREMMLELRAAQSHGQERVEAAKRAAEELRDSGGPAIDALAVRLLNTANPFDELVRWHDEHARMSQFGDDPEAYINAEVERRLAGGPPQHHPAASFPRSMPPSFAGARNGAPRQSQNYGGPRPLSEIMKR